MANEKQLRILRKGPEIWNAWRQKHPGIKLDFFEANLSEAKANELARLLPWAWKAERLTVAVHA